MRDATSAVRIVIVHPDLLGTYGDGGNGLVLFRRLRWRGLPAELVEAMSGSPVPASGDIYCLGGGEDAAQSRAAEELGQGHPLGRAVENGAAVLAVCAGFQVIGTSFAAADGGRRKGLGLIEAETTKGAGPRPVGELWVRPEPELGLPELTGYENHGGVTRLGPEVTPLGQVSHGIGNGDGSGAEGARSGRIVGTYMHGPVLARNPDLADYILTSVVGGLPPLAEEGADQEAEALRAERRRSVLSSGPTQTGHPPRLVARLRRLSRPA